MDNEYSFPDEIQNLRAPDVLVTPSPPASQSGSEGESNATAQPITYDTRANYDADPRKLKFSIFGDGRLTL